MFCLCPLNVQLVYFDFHLMSSIHATLLSQFNFKLLNSLKMLRTADLSHVHYYFFWGGAPERYR